MKLKSHPEDFIVEEVTSLKILDSIGLYKVYLLEKKGIETFALMNNLSSRFKIPKTKFGIAGLKDKHAITKQYITLASKYPDISINEENLKIKFIGYSNKPLKVGDLLSNKFTIVVRNIKKKDITEIIRKAKDIEHSGIPNYFDSQRFGSLVAGKFIAKYIINGEYENAVKIFLTEYTKTEKSKLKTDKKNISQNWKSLTKVKIHTKHLKSVVNEYLKTKDWIKAYKKIPANIREMAIFAYQSFIWNECIKQVIKDTINKKYIHSIPYKVGSLLFYENIPHKIPLTFKTISSEMSLNAFEQKIIEKVLTKEKITLKQLDNVKIIGNFLKTQERETICYPKNFKILEILPDEVNKNKFRIRISFELNKGSYATLVTKRLFNK